MIASGQTGEGPERDYDMFRSFFLTHSCIVYTNAQTYVRFFLLRMSAVSVVDYVWSIFKSSTKLYLTYNLCE